MTDAAKLYLKITFIGAPLMALASTAVYYLFQAIGLGWGALFYVSVFWVFGLIKALQVKHD